MLVSEEQVFVRISVFFQAGCMLWLVLLVVFLICCGGSLFALIILKCLSWMRPMKCFHVASRTSQLYQLDEISANCIVAYIWHLYKNMMTDTIRGKFRFMNPHSIPFIMTTPCDNKGKLEQLNQRATVLSDRLSSASVDQLVLVPCNVGFHWILIVIQPYTELVYVLDSLSHRMRYDDWKYIVEMALRLFNSNKGRKGRKNPVWELLQAPRQPDGKQCGYYVMRFMRQIIAEIETIERDGLRSIFKAAEYTRAEIDEVRSEVADCIQDHIYE